MNRLLFIILLSLSLQGCEFWDYLLNPYDTDEPIILNNMSDETLTAYFAFGSADKLTLYPDTALPQSAVVYKPEIGASVSEMEEDLCNNFVPPHSCENYTWGGDYNSHRNDTLSVFIISRDTLIKYGYENVRQNYRILVRYDFSWQELQREHFIISYPPTASMCETKMYPAYSQLRKE